MISIYLAEGNKCEKEMKKGKISPEFAKHVSHAIHSLTIEDLHMYFDKRAGVNNSIPVGKSHYKDLNFTELDILTRTMLVGWSRKLV